MSRISRIVSHASFAAAGAERHRLWPSIRHLGKEHVTVEFRRGTSTRKADPANRDPLKRRGNYDRHIITRWPGYQFQHDPLPGWHTSGATGFPLFGDAICSERG